MRPNIRKLAAGSAAEGAQAPSGVDGHRPPASAHNQAERDALAKLTAHIQREWEASRMVPFHTFTTIATRRTSIAIDASDLTFVDSSV